MTPRLARIAEIACALVLMALLADAAGPASAAPAGNGPAVDVTSKYMTRSSDYVLTGRIRGYSELKSLTVSPNGNQTQAVPLAETFKVPLKLKPGQNEILLKTIDKAGHSATNMVVVTLEGSTQVGINPAALALWHKKYEEQMQAMRKELAKEPAPVMTQSAAESVKALNDSAAELKKTLASLGAATTPTPEPEGGSSVAAKKSPPEKRIDNTAPLIEITSPRDTVSTHYLLAGSVTDDTGVSRLTVSLNQGKLLRVKLDHGRFQSRLDLKHGSNVIRVAAADNSGHKAIQRLEVSVSHPTSDQLIDAAVKRGKLDKNKALVYKIYAAFGVPKLPEEYLGDDTSVTDNHILDKAVSRFNELPLSVKKQIVPFLIPPFYKGSWLSELHRTGNSSVMNYSQEPLGVPKYHIRSAVFVKTKGENESSKTGSWGLDGSASNRNHRRVVGVSTDYVPPCKLNPGDCQIASGWDYIDGKHVRVWYLNKHFPSDDKPNKKGEAYFYPIGLKKETYKQQAERILAAMQKHIWPKLTKLMGRKPISDGDLFTNGGNGLLDIAIVPGYLHMKGVAAPNVLGVAVKNSSLVGFAGGDYALPYLHFGCRREPVYIELRRTLSDKVMHDDLAHEFMHALQWTYKTKNCTQDYSWLMESTATWAIDYVFQDDNWEHHFAADFIKNPQIPLDKVGNNHEYWSYLFFFYLRWHLKSADIVRKTWEATLKEPLGIQAAADALKTYKKKMEKIFPLFAVTNLNDGPIDSYVKWDGIGGKEDIKNGIDASASYKWFKVDLGQNGDIALPFLAKGKGLDHLTARHFVFPFKGVPARSVAVFNGYSYKLSPIKRKGTGLAGSVSQSRLAAADVWAVKALRPKDKKGRHLQALVKIGGKWQRNSSNGKPYVEVGAGNAFCASSPDERIDVLVLVASNSRMPGKDDVLAPRGHPPLVYASNMGCGPWKGTIEADDDGPDSVHGQWTFTTNFTTGPMQPDIAPVRTEGQYKNAMSGGTHSPGAGDMNDIAGLLSGGSGKSTTSSNSSANANLPFGWPAAGRFLLPFGAILSFGTGVTKWSASYPNCGDTSGEYKNLILVMTYNFVQSGELYRHYMLVSWPVPIMSISMAKLASDPSQSSGLPYREWDPESKSCDMEHREPPGQPFLGTMEKDGVHAQGSVSGADYMPGNGSANYYFHLQVGPGKN